MGEESCDSSGQSLDRHQAKRRTKAQIGSPLKQRVAVVELV